MKTNHTLYSASMMWISVLLTLALVNEDGFGKIHFEGDHHVHVIKVFRDHLQLDTRFDVDFNVAFPTGPARPHGFDMK